MKTYTYEEIANKYGENIARQAIENGQAEPTSRVIYTSFEPDHGDRHEWVSDPLILDNYDIIRACWFLTDEDEQNIDSFDWEGNVEFVVE